jgi:hypothetical protein
VSQRTDGRDQWAHDSPSHWAHALRDRRGGEISIEHGETTFFGDDLRILLMVRMKQAMHQQGLLLEHVTSSERLSMPIGSRRATLDGQPDLQM